MTALYRQTMGDSKFRHWIGGCCNSQGKTWKEEEEKRRGKAMAVICVQ